MTDHFPGKSTRRRALWRVAAVSTVCAAWFAAAASLHAQVYKIEDEHGNVTYTDQAPGDGAEPMELPGLSVVETEPVETLPGAEDDEVAPAEPTPRELRRMYRDFAITRPANEETFWGTGNQVVVSWGAANPLLPDMRVRLYLDGEAQEETRQTMIALELDRGEHSVYAELLDHRGRRLITTPTVTFFVKQNSRLFNNPGG